MKHNAIKYWLVVLLVLVLTCVVALAATTGFIRVTITDLEDEPVPDMTISLYKIVEGVTLEHNFKSSLTGLTSSDIRNDPHNPDYARILAQCATDYSVTPTAQQTSGYSGRVQFNDLTQGVYLVTGAGDTAKFDPFLVPMPIVINSMEDWQIEAEPKAESVVSNTGTVILTKVDSEDTSKTLSNVVFDLYKANGTKVDSCITENGKITKILGPGTYYWLEIRPAEGYVKDNTKHFFTIRPGQTHRMTLTNTHAEVPSVFGSEHYAFVIGYPDGLVHPEGNITRAEMVTIFFRMLNEDTRNQYLTRTNNFSDVYSSDWYNTAISTMANMGAIEGYPDGTFGPKEHITRAELIALAARFDPDGDTTSSFFTDIEGHWAEDEINIAANNGWTLGNGTDKFNPDDLITRAEAMAIVNRVLQRLPETTDDLLPGMVTWPDNMDTSKWYYLAVQEATNSHDYVRKDNGYESWTKLTKVPNWKKYE